MTVQDVSTAEPTGPVLAAPVATRTIRLVVALRSGGLTRLSSMSDGWALRCNRVTWMAEARYVSRWGVIRLRFHIAER